MVASHIIFAACVGMGMDMYMEVREAGANFWEKSVKFKPILRHRSGGGIRWVGG